MFIRTLTRYADVAETSLKLFQAVLVFCCDKMGTHVGTMMVIFEP